MNSTLLRYAMLAGLTTLLYGCPDETPEPDKTILTMDMEQQDDAGSMTPDATPDLPDMMVVSVEDMMATLDMVVDPVDMSEPEDMAPDLVDDIPPDMPQGIEPGPLTVASFNVELFFDTVCDTGDCGEDSFERLPTEDQLQQRYAFTGAGIDRLAADIIVFQEIETESLFETLVMGTQQGYTAMAFGEIGRDASIDVAVAARGELLEVKRHRQDVLTLADGSERSFARELLEVHVKVRGARVIVFGAHYISKFNPSNTPRRTAEAARTAELALGARALYPNALIVVAGDLNDTPDSEPLMQFANAGLKSASAGRPLEEIYTNVFGVELQAIDHILYLETPGVSFDESNGLEVFRDEGESGLSGSDHAAPRATFMLE